MSKVLFMQNCFCPDENQFKRLKRSLLSLENYTRHCKPQHEYRFVLSGYVHENYVQNLVIFFDEWMDINLFFTQGIFLDLNTENIGKGKVCNKCIPKYTHNQDYSHVFMFDNDIVFKECPHDIVDILIKQQDEMDTIGNLKYPVISCNFEEHQVHNIEAMDQGHHCKDGRLVKCSTGHFGVLGGGCWLVRKEHWDKLGGYCSDTIYGKDDGKFYLDTIRDGMMVALSMDICVIHPSDEDDAYNRFKADTNVNRVLKMNYDELTTDSNNFWGSR